MHIVLAAHYAKAAAVWLFGVVAGWAASLWAIMIMQIDPDKIPWYESPTFIAAVVSGTMVILVSYINRRWARRDKTEEQEREDDERFRTFSDRKEELSHAERRELIALRNDVHKQELSLLHEQIINKEVDVWATRQRAHRMGNEVNRQQGHIMVLRMKMVEAGVPPDHIPEFEMKGYDKIMEGIEDEIDAYRDKLRGVPKAEDVRTFEGE